MSSSEHSRRRPSRRVLVGAAIAALVVVGGVVGGLLATSSSSAGRPQAFSHEQYVTSFTNALPGKMAVEDLEAWPPPYNKFMNQYRQQCYEWFDKGYALYDLCFDHGLLRFKAIE
jgi:hypothetical protein